MDCSAAVSALLSNVQDLPTELIDIIQRGCDTDFLAAITQTALIPRYTERLFAHLEPIFTDICARWTEPQSWEQAIPAFGRILWFSPLHAEFVEKLLIVADIDLSSSEDDIREYLLGLFRLLTYDLDGFRRYVPIQKINLLLIHENRAIRYLAIRVSCQYLQAADAAMEAMIKRHLGNEAVTGRWEEKEIDYRFFVLWERKRYESLSEALKIARQQRVVGDAKPVVKRIIKQNELSSLTANAHGILLPRPAGQPGASSSAARFLVPTSTTVLNIRNLGQALLESRPLLITGLSGVGKTRLVTHLASELNKAQAMITLHLNEQTDAKSLLGTYVTGANPGTFQWSPGVITKAVKEGSWLLFEDLNHAPNEILSTLLPLIERSELIIPGRGEVVRAARGFRILATMRSHLNHRGEEIAPGVNMLGNRFWRRVPMQMMGQDELQQIVSTSYSRLEAHVSGVMSVYGRIQEVSKNASLRAQSRYTLRPTTLRDLLKWCDRMDALASRSVFSDEQLNDFFLEAVDCFAGSLQEGDHRDAIIAVIAEELHIDPKKRDYLLSNRQIRFQGQGHDPVLRVGRATLPRSIDRENPNRATASRPFANNNHTLRLLEKTAVAVDRNEPLLLVGETGTGKTTCIQHLADQLGQKLVAFNLSQQSEAGDLLGGFKPVTVRSIIIPLKDEFDELFASTFNRRKNQQFLVKLGECVAKSKWSVVCKLFNAALGMVEEMRKSSPRSPSVHDDEQPKKRRKIDTVDARWDNFATSVKQLEARLKTKSEAFAFSFIESGLVKAAREGHFALLDEINLASPDTLEAIAGLLGGGSDGASILLTETGERVKAHKDFRVFAAMNPASDVGKRDLPLGIRSRLTEIFVDSPDRDRDSLLTIVRTYLAGPDAQIANDVTDLYRRIQQLSESNVLVDSADQKPHFSLRTLTRTLTYAKDIAPLCSLRRALYEGFHMSFLTFLNKQSEDTVAPLIKQYLFGRHTNVASELKKPMRKPQDGHEYVQYGHHWLRRGSCAPEPQPQYIITPFIQRNMTNLIRASSTRRFPVLIQGPTSSGKTSMIEYLAKISGNKFVRINNHEHTDLQEYLGTYVSGADGQLHFQEGVLVKAIREGSWCVLDELNLAPTDVMESLNRLLDDNRELLIPETQEVVRPHENFMLFSTQNPAGLYGGRKVLSRAFRNRFLELHFDDIPVDELSTILHQRTQIPEKWSKKIVEVYRKLSDLRQENRLFEQKSFATLRDLFRWAGRKADTQEQLAINGYMLLAERVRKPAERDAVREAIDSVMSPGERGPHGRINTQHLYDADRSPEIQLYNETANAAGVVWTSAMRRLYILVAHCLRNDEPVLLVGETGTGKTTVCQMLADTFGKKLSIVNAHQNTETGDLIGAQRPIRNRAATEEQLRNELRALLHEVRPNEDTSSMDLTTLLAVFDKLPKATSDSIALEKRQSVKTLRQRMLALFAWSDGSLVSCMRSGDFFLLDEINLCDDAVLERLNSVLEPERRLLLAEKGSQEAQITANSGFQFLASMNPGGDYGKKELSPALRNRFTEIYMPAIEDINDILHIVQSKLSPEAAGFAPMMVSFAQFFNSNYNKSAASAISIRDTLAWVTFVNQFAGADITTAKAAIVHGAAMTYIDSLGANPAAVLAIAGADVKAERQRCLKELSRLLETDAAGIYNEPIEVTRSEACFSVGPFSIPVYHAPQSIEFSFAAPTTKNNAMRVARALQLDKPILLEGNPGVGKTALISAMARETGMPLTRINLSEQTDLMDLFGSDAPAEDEQVGRFKWRDAGFLRAMKKGQWVLLDEMNLASQSVLEGLNAILDHRAQVYIPELDSTFSRHPNFRLFAAQNPHSQGGGRKGLPASFVNRFTVVHCDALNVSDFSLICKYSFPAVPDQQLGRLIRFVDRLENEVQRRHFGSQGSPWEFNLRDVLRWLHLLSSKEGLLPAGEDHDFLATIFTQRFRNKLDRASVEALFGEVFGSPPPSRHYYHNTSPDTFQAGLGLLKRNTILRPTLSSKEHVLTSQLGALESSIIAIQQNWPIILAGPANSGKTSLIQLLASMAGAELSTFSMNADVDANDLIGGYEQADPTREELAFISKLKYFLQAHTIKIESRIPAAGGVETWSINHLLHQLNTCNFADLDKELISAVLHRYVQDIGDDDMVASLQKIFSKLQRQSSGTEKANFVWVDGLLVTCLEQGRWLNLDNANLASSSVLDRLNSLLEPNGSLIINEHSTSDGEPRVVYPHPSFRIFLTLNPKYGELSRAMRNRAVEIFVLPEESDEMKVSLPSFQLESAMYRFQHLNHLDGMKTTSTEPGKVADVAVDHLGIGDSALLNAFRGQIAAGLYAQPALTAQVELLTQVLQPWVSTDWVQHIQISPIVSGISRDFSLAQSVHPLNNRYTFARNSKPAPIALAFDFTRDVAGMERALKAADDGSSKAVTRLQKSLRGISARSGTRDPTASVGPFLRAVLEKVAQWIGDGIRSGSLDATLIQKLKPVIRFFHNVLALCDHADVDDAVFQSYVSIGRDILTALTQDQLSSQSNALPNLQQDIATLGQSSQLTTGLSMESIWLSFRPNVVTTWERLQALSDIESLADRIDAAIWASRMNVLEMESVRSTLAKAMAAVAFEGADPEGLLKELSAAVSKLEERSGIDDGVFEPHLKAEFECIAQYTDVAVTMGQEVGNRAAIGLLAGRPSKFASQLGAKNNTPESLSYTLASVLGEFATSGTPGMLDQGLGTSLMAQLNRSGEVSLASLDLFRSELDILGSTMATDTEALLKVQPLSLSVLLEQLLSRFPDDAHHDLLGEACDFLVCDSGMKTVGSMSMAWIKFSLAGILLFLPDKAYDPALRSSIVQKLWYKHLDDLNSTLAALQAFEMTFTGGLDNLRIQAIGTQILELGTAPDVPAIARPPNSQISRLQQIWNSILRQAKRVEDGIRKGNLAVLHDPLLVQNLDQIIKRLSQNYLGYKDMTGPAVLFLRCLKLGIVLTSLKRKSDALMSYLKASTPFMSMARDFWTMPGNTPFPASAQGTTQSRLHALASMAVVRTITPREYQTHLFCGHIEDIFEIVYNGWKKQLEEEQTKAAADSSLYTYRGGDDEQEGQDEAELEELFPDYEKPEADRTNRNMSISPRDLAIKLADLHAAIFLTDKTPLYKLHQLNALAIEALGHVQSEGPSDVGLNELLPLLITSLQCIKASTAETQVLSLTYDFYTDSNIAEARKLITLVRTVQVRFHKLQQLWPEHATIADILRICAELLAFRYTEPVAKLLTKTEKLHETIYQWQKVASKEHSAATLYDEVTNLIVSWRRLELSTWARLLDMETQKAVADAKSFFFLAYETVIIAPRSATDMSSFARELFKTLETFFTNTTLGQYSERLKLLRQLKEQVAAIKEDVPEMAPIETVLANFISYFARFEATVVSELIKGRQTLEKSVKDVLQLASWRDTNIDALRQSAKTSHRKLFKIVRKFREVLSRPVYAILAQGMPDVEPSSSSGLQEHLPMMSVDSQAVALSEQHFLEWKQRPDRLINVSSTISRMEKMSKPQTDSDAAEAVSFFLNNALSAMSELRIATPSTLTDENTALVKHLKTRKRKLLTDTLKELRRFGLKSSLGGDLLAKQDSLSTVLASLPPILDDAPAGLAESDLYLHKLLQIIPDSRNISREHSDDLMPAEVARCIGYVESLLALEISQRKHLAKAESERTALQEAINKAKALWMPEKYTILSSSHEDESSGAAKHNMVSWLTLICNHAAEVVTAQASLGKFDASVVINGLRKWAQSFKQMTEAFNHKTLLPKGLQTSAHNDICQMVGHMVDTFKSELQQWRGSHPPLAHILQHLAQWTVQESRHDEDLITNGIANGTTEPLTKQLQHLSDFILGSIQDLQRSYLTEDPENSWLIARDVESKANISSLRISTIAPMLNTTLDHIHHLDVNPSDGFQPITALIATVLPLFEQYLHIAYASIEKYTRLHLAISKMSYHLAKAFINLGRNGFCTPSEKSNDKDGKDDKLEGGTGLGEGEGAEDISKDIQDDEDLTELAQEPNQKTDKEEIEDEKDAVDMGAEDLEGEMGDAAEQENEDGDAKSDEGDQEDMEDEVGDVDDLGPSTVDEKLWDDKDEADSGKEKEGDEGKGQKKDDQVAAQDNKGEAGEQQEEQEEDAEGGAEESEAVSKDQLEQTDPHLQQEEALDLPDDIDMDGNKSEGGDDDDLDSLDDDFPAEEKTQDQDIDIEMEEDMPPEGEPTIGDEIDQEGQDIDEKGQAEEDQEKEPEEQEPEADITALPDTTEAGLDSTDETMTESNAQSAGAEQQDEGKDEPSTTAAAQQESGSKSENQTAQPQAAGEDGSEQQTSEQQAFGRSEDNAAQAQKEPFKKLGDTLERWYRQQRQIREAAKEDNGPSQPQAAETNMDDVDFEHLPDADAQADAQALGAATEEQARALDDEMALDVNDQKDADMFPEDEQPDQPQEKAEAVDTEMQDAVSQQKDKEAQAEERQLNAFIGDPSRPTNQPQSPDNDLQNPLDEEELDVEEVDAQLSTVHLDPTAASEDGTLTIDEARAIWSQHSSHTSSLSASLCESLRLVLAPSLATKMRGDFRTGKRLNIKRIIPFIASQYKRDKIWMRRSVPSKRTYQIMLALDDSKSMKENGSSALAFETLSLVSKALSMLEAGELAVVGFGKDVFVAHDFAGTWSEEAGAEVVRQFGFRQGKTDVKKLVGRSLELFREARGRARDAELWQLQLIISDGLCENHEHIARLVRQAQEERIMIVFVIVDAAASNTGAVPNGGAMGKNKKGIMDMETAEFGVDANGKMELKRTRYIDTFPFRWFVVVRDVRELPGVLSAALRQWFAEVVDTQG